MDAYDIFKKLTKGLTFKYRVLGKDNDNKSKPLAIKKEETEIKEELESDKGDHEPQSGSDSEIEDCDNQSSEKTTEHEGDLELVKGVTVGDKKKKKKKKEMTEGLKKKLEMEEQNRFRNIYGIKVVGRHVPAAFRDFSELMTRYNMSQSLVDSVKQCGYDEPTPVQRQALPCMLEDRQILACAPTGSGKTAAFLLPVLHSLGAPQGGPRALILCPTRELAHQIYREGLRLSAGTELRVSVLKTIKESKVKEREATIRKSDIVITTPNRLCYLLNQDNVGISLEKVHWLIIDEADKMFEGSSDEQSAFRQQLEQIMAVTGQKQRRLAMFSATHTPAVAEYSRRHMRGLINITVGQRNTATDLVDQELLYCGNEQGKLVGFRQLVQKGLKPPVLVFVQSKERAKQLFKELIYDGINVDVIHADRTQAQRDNVVRSFRVGRIWVLICTELMGRGIDFRGVNLVLNYDFPPSAIAYIHRIGRAGRAGQRGKAVTFFTQDDVANLRSIASVMKQSGCEVPEYMLRLKQNPNVRKARMRKAPRRDNISTILEKPSKRKLEENPEQKDDKSKDTPAVKSGTHGKKRKIQAGGLKEHKKNQDGRQKFTKNSNTKSKDNKKLLKKNKKKVVVKKVRNKA